MISFDFHVLKWTNRTHHGHNQRQILNFCLTGSSGYPVTGPDPNQIIRYDLNGLYIDNCDPARERKCGPVPSLRNSDILGDPIIIIDDSCIYTFKYIWFTTIIGNYSNKLVFHLKGAFTLHFFLKFDFWNLKNFSNFKFQKSKSVFIDFKFLIIKFWKKD